MLGHHYNTRWDLLIQKKRNSKSKGVLELPRSLPCSVILYLDSQDSPYSLAWPSFLTVKGHTAKSAEGKTHGTTSGVTQAQASQSPVPVWSHRTCLTPLAASVQCCLWGKLSWAEESSVFQLPVLTLFCARDIQLSRIFPSIPLFLFLYLFLSMSYDLLLSLCVCVWDCVCVCVSYTVLSCFGLLIFLLTIYPKYLSCLSIASNLALNNHEYRCLRWSSACIYAVSFSGLRADHCLGSPFPPCLPVMS